MSTHSAILGGSNADRILNCPASYAEQMKLPATDTASIYAAEGTLLHDAMAQRMTRKGPVEILLNDEQVEVLANAHAALRELTDKYGGGFRVVAIEALLPLPGVTGAFGSVDLILANATTIIVLDWKFGAGVTVKALYEDDDGSQRVNPQLMFYAVAARAKYRRRFKDRMIVLAIIQPRVPEPLSYVETDMLELDQFQLAFQTAYLEALTKNAHRERGSWCRFAPCKTTCPLWSGPVLDLALLDPAKAALQASTHQATPGEYHAFLSKALDMATLAEFWVEEIRRQAHVIMEDGGTIPGWKLVPKRARRQWVDEAAAENALLDIGADENDIFTAPDLKSVAQVEKALKPAGIAVPPELWMAVSSGTTIAPESDKRPPADRARVMTELKLALKAL